LRFRAQVRPNPKSSTYSSYSATLLGVGGTGRGGSPRRILRWQAVRPRSAARCARRTIAGACPCIAAPQPPPLGASRTTPATSTPHEAPAGCVSSSYSPPPIPRRAACTRRQSGAPRSPTSTARSARAFVVDTCRTLRRSVWSLRG